jgi:hypothetical protein
MRSGPAPLYTYRVALAVEPYSSKCVEGVVSEVSAGIEFSEVGLSKEEESDVRAYRCRGSYRGVRDRAI